jgi:hypothetical protein
VQIEIVTMFLLNTLNSISSNSGTRASEKFVIHYSTVTNIGVGTGRARGAIAPPLFSKLKRLNKCSVSA